MLEMGQPMHAFDCDYLEGNAIRVRRAEKGEKITTLDSQEYTLNPENLVICDGVKPVALAGVMGGLNSEIRDTTAEVMFESAKFARDNIRKTSRALGKRTDASAKYEKGVDEYTTVNALKRALHLIEELGCGKVSSTHVDVNTGNSLEPREMKVSVSRVNDVLGIQVPDGEILRIMKNLQFAPVISGDELTLQVPAFREDMDSYPDVAEEVIRMYGYDHVVPTFMPDAQVTMGGMNVRQKKELKLKRALCSQGAYECIHYSFFSPSDLDLLRLPEDAPERRAIRILNPINEELSLMRTTLAASMLNAIARNNKRGTLEGRLFEIGKVFVPKELPLNDYPDERETLCVGIFGEKESFFTLKGIAEKTAQTLFLKFEYRPSEKTYLHPYQTADIYCEGVKVGYLGKVAYEVAENLDLRTGAFVMEIDLKLLSQWYDRRAAFTPLSKFPEESRDLALVMSREVSCGQVEEVINRSCSYIKSIHLFDVYEGEQIPEDKKSMAFTIEFKPKDEAFEADSVDRFVAKILKNLKKQLDIDLRS
jgi:phenylalanyl-tRNA synthetase beta chain